MDIAEFQNLGSTTENFIVSDREEVKEVLRKRLNVTEEHIEDLLGVGKAERDAADRELPGMAGDLIKGYAVLIPHDDCFTAIFPKRRRN